MVIVIELDSASLTARALAGADDLPTRATAPIRFFVTSHMPDWHLACSVRKKDKQPGF